MTKILLALAVASLVTACDGQFTEWTAWNPCSCLRVMGGGYRLRIRESNTEAAETDYGLCTEQMCPPCPVTPECTADRCVMAVHDECWVLNVLDKITTKANDAKSACVAAYGDAAQLPEAATQADLDAIFALSQTHNKKPVWMSATDETNTGSWVWESGTNMEAELWRPRYPKSSSTPHLCSIILNKNNNKVMINRRCDWNWKRSVVCAAPIVHDTSDSGADTQTIPLSFLLAIDVSDKNLNEGSNDYETLKTEIETQLETEISSVITGVRVIVTGMENRPRDEKRSIRISKRAVSDLKVNFDMVVPSEIEVADKQSALEYLTREATITVDGNTGYLHDVSDNVVISADNPWSEAIRQKFLDDHNMFRRREGATDMAVMEYNLDLEANAQVTANKCAFTHSSGDLPPPPEGGHRNDVAGFDVLGENLFYTSAKKTHATLPTLAWYAEKKDYDFVNRVCTPGKPCGHYTQLVWSTSTHLGCAAAVCEETIAETSGPGILVVCVYGPSGNRDMVRQDLYIPGIDKLAGRDGVHTEACRDCPHDRPYCDDGLCSNVEGSGPTKVPTAQITITPDEYCKQRKGPDSFMCRSRDRYYWNDTNHRPGADGGHHMCQSIDCQTSNEHARCCSVTTENGLICGVDKVCVNGDCVEDPTLECQKLNLNAECLFGDAPRTTQGLRSYTDATPVGDRRFTTCAEMLDRDGPEVCQRDLTSDVCCQTCLDLINESTNPCPFGDAQPAFCDGKMFAVLSDEKKCRSGFCCSKCTYDANNNRVIQDCDDC